MEDHVLTSRGELEASTSSVCELLSFLEDSLLQNITVRTRGRRPLNISNQQLLFLYNNDPSLPDMAHTLSCSTRTV